MDNNRKNIFKHTLLSSAIFLTIQSMAAPAAAETCPSPNEENNIHVTSGEFCEGDIAPNVPVNDIGIEGYVKGNVFNEDGVSDFWMNGGTLEGSFVNFDGVNSINIRNGSRISFDIYNAGMIGYISIVDTPGGGLVGMDGSIINNGYVEGMELSGVNVRVGGDIHNRMDGVVDGTIYLKDGAMVAGNIINEGVVDGSISLRDGATVAGNITNEGFIDGSISLRDGATVAGNIINDGEVDQIMVDGAIVEQSVINNGQLDEVTVMNGGHVKGDVVNNFGEDNPEGDGFTHIDELSVKDGATVDGNLINNGNVFGIGVMDGATVHGNVENHGINFYTTIGDGSTVTGSVINSGETVFLDIRDGATITKDLVNEGLVERIIVDSSTIQRNLLNHGLIENGISVDGSTINGSLINAEDGLIAADGNAISLMGRTSVGAIINHGTITAGNYGIVVDGEGHDGASVTGDIVNTHDGVITTEDNGIYVVDGMVAGNIINDGTITSTEDNAIDIEYSTVGGNIAINGNLTTDEHYDALDVNGSTILGNVTTGPQSLITSGEDGLDIDESTIAGSVISEATINAANEGFDFDNTHITGDLINKGQITAGRTGLSFVGEMDYVPIEMEMPDGPMMLEDDGLIPVVNMATIGGHFVNEGEISAGERGIELELVDIGKNFENFGTISSDTDTAIHIAASTIQGDFINKGDLYADLPPAWDEGQHYSTYMDQQPTPEGSVMLTSMGIDRHNQSWLKISNEGDSPKEIQLEEVGGGFASGPIQVHPGQEIVINVGEHNGGAQSYQLTDINAMEQLAVEAAGTQNFMPDIQDSEQVQRGIALVGGLYDDDELMMDGQVNIGGNFVNEGDITAIDEAIALENVTIGGNFTNSGQLISMTNDGILFQDNVAIGGNFTNSGDIFADATGIYLDGDAYLNDDGILAGDGLITIGGDFINSGDINAGSNGVKLRGVELGKHFINQGDITAEEGSAIDISHTIINGNIENYGTLTITDEDGSDHGLSLRNSQVKGSVINFGDMSVSGTEGIKIDDSVIEGSVVNAEGTTIDAYSDAIIIEDGTIKGDLINSGTLIARNHDGIDLDDVYIEGNVINTGTITSGDNAFELDGEDDGYMVIKGSLINSGHLTTQAPEDGESIGNGNGFDFDYVDIKTSLNNSGNIDSVNHGFLIEKSRIGQNFINSGDLTVANSGIVLAGKDPDSEGGPIPLMEGEETPPSHRVEIGGAFYNEGTISAGQNGIELEMADIGTNGVTADGAANFENHGDIDVTRGTAITLNDSTVAGDFVNTGNLTASFYAYQQGDSYRQPFEGELAPHDEFPVGIQLEAMGRDGNGDAWFRVQLDQNQGGGFPIKLFDENGEFSFSGQYVEAGEEIYINAGSIDGDVTLTLDFGGPMGEEGPVIGMVAPSESSFSPEYDPRHGILLTDSDIGGSFINQGNIDAYHSAIAMEHTDIGGGFSNTGALTSQHSGIELNDLSIGGGIYNGGTITSAESGIDLDGVEITGGLVNDGDITSGESGIVLHDVEMGGGLYNGGSISGESGIVLHDVEMNGGFHNNGSILAEDDGMLAMDVTMDGVMVNTGTIEASTGMLMFGSDGATGFVNEGAITTEGPGMVVIDSSVAGNIGVGVDGVINTEEFAGVFAGNVWNVRNLYNHGEITVIEGDGITAHDLEMDQNVINTGTITAGYDGISLYGSEADSFRNSGSITAGTYAPEDGEAHGSGIVLEDVSLNGDIHNLVGGQIVAATHGIELADGSTTTNIINEGSIEVGVDGIRVSGSHIGQGEDGESSTGNIFNMITGVINALDDAIRVGYGSWVKGDIGNAGVITAGENAIDIDDSTVDGQIINTGTITAGEDAISLSSVEVGGRLANVGTITAEGSGIVLDDVDMNGGVFNSGTISARDYGIQVNDSTLNGSVINEVGGVISLNDDGFSAGISLDGVSGVKDFINQGTIEQSSDSYGDGMSAMDVSMDGMMANTGTIEADNGMRMSSSDGATGFINEGTIISRGTAMRVHSSSVAGNIGVGTNGVINSQYSGIHIEFVSDVENLFNQGEITASNGDGIYAHHVDMDQDVTNTGIITAGHDGISLDDVDADNIKNSGSITAGTYMPEADGEGPMFDDGYQPYGSGIVLEDGSLKGDIHNLAGGQITAATHGIEITDGSTTNILNEGSITAGSEGIRVDNSVVGQPEGDGDSNTGNIFNMLTGVIDAVGDAIQIGFNSLVTGDVGNAGVITAGTDGIDINDSTIGGQIINTGTITAGGDAISLSLAEVGGGLANQGTITAEGSGIMLDDVDMNGGVFNGGTISARDYGILVSDSALNGSVINDVDGVISLNDDGFSAGISLDGVSGVKDFINQGTIEQSSGGYGDGMSAMDVSMDGMMANTGTIEADNGMQMSSSDGATGFINEGTIISRGTAMRAHSSSVAGNIGVGVDGVINSQYSGIHVGSIGNVQNLFNYGEIEASKGSGIHAHNMEMDQNVTNTGTITAGHDGISLYDVDADNIQNSGSITAGTYMPEADGEGPMFDDGYQPYGSGIVLDDGSLEGDIHNLAGGQIVAATHGIVIGGSTVDGMITNAGTITATDAAIAVGHEYSDGSSSVGGLINTGTIVSQIGAALRVMSSSIGSLFNSGTLTGGEVSGDTVETTRTIADGSIVAMDFRTATSRLDFKNSGAVTGDIYGSNELDDFIEIVAGSLNGDVYDVETIDVTGAITLNNDIFSFNDSSTLTVKSSGTLDFGTTNKVTVQGNYVQDGAMIVDLKGNTRLDEPVVDVTGTAVLNAGSTVLLEKDDNIANFNPGFEGTNIHLVHADAGVTDNGIELQVESESILFNYNTFTENEGTEFGVTSSVNNLGTLVANNGVSSNAANAISTLQGDNSAGLINLYNNNRELYDAIYDADLTGLTELAEALVAGNPVNGIAVSQNAQNEAINTILNRIADLRSGASGLSAGDNGVVSLRPDSLWIRGIYSDGEQKASGEFGGYNLRSKGFTLGVDKDINDYLTLGMGMTMVSSTANQTSSSTSGNNSETDSYLGSLYASWRNRDYFVDANLNVGTSNTDLSGTASSTSWKTDFDSKQLALSVMAGKSFLFNNNDSLVEPSIGFNYSRLKSDSYSYDVSGAKTTVDDTTLSTLEAGVGVRVMTSVEMGSGLLLPEASLMAWHDFKAEKVKAEIGFENSSETFTYYGPKGVKDRYQASVGAEYQMDNNVTLSITYDHNWQSDFKADTVQAKLRYDF